MSFVDNGITSGSNNWRSGMLRKLYICTFLFKTLINVMPFHRNQGKYLDTNWFQLKINQNKDEKIIPKKS